MQGCLPRGIHVPVPITILRAVHAAATAAHRAASSLSSGSAAAATLAATVNPAVATATVSSGTAASVHQPAMDAVRRDQLQGRAVLPLWLYLHAAGAALLSVRAHTGLRQLMKRLAMRDAVTPEHAAA